MPLLLRVRLRCTRLGVLLLLGLVVGGLDLLDRQILLLLALLLLVLLLRILRLHFVLLGLDVHLGLLGVLRVNGRLRHEDL